MKHTPGPWEARLTKYYGKSDDQQELTVGTADQSICILTASRGHTLEAMPDARLIAAAPDLLAALQHIRQNCFIYCDSSMDIDNNANEMADEAIRKAIL